MEDHSEARVTLMVKAKRNPKLSEISAAVAGRQPKTEVEVLGHTYQLELLKPEAEDWVAQNTEGVTAVAAVMNSQKPTIAAALVGVDGIPVEELFQFPEGADDFWLEQMKENAKARREWRRGEILDWLKEESDPYVIDEIFKAYSRMSKEHREALKEANFTKTPS